MAKRIGWLRRFAAAYGPLAAEADRQALVEWWRARQPVAETKQEFRGQLDVFT